MKIVYSNQIKIPHSDYVTMNLNGQCNLGVPNDLAEKIAVETNLMPGSLAGKKNWVGIFLSLGIMAYSIYLSFTFAWWIFIPGWLLAGIISLRNRKNTSKDVLKYALENQEFYNLLVASGSVSFQIDDKLSQKYEL